MPAIEIACAECGHTLQVEEAVLGTTMKCPKCKFDFVAETGDAYGLAEDFSAEPSGSPASADRRADVPTGSPASSASSRRDSKPETEAQRKLREKMERWAED